VPRAKVAGGRQSRGSERGIIQENALNDAIHRVLWSGVSYQGHVSTKEKLERVRQPWIFVQRVARRAAAVGGSE
jgi:hypothetical protein